MVINNIVCLDVHHSPPEFQTSVKHATEERPYGTLAFVAGPRGNDQPKEFFRSIFELSSIGIAVASPEFGWASVNPRLCSMLGYSEDELRDRSWLDLTHPDDAPRDLVRYERMLKGDLDAYELEKRFVRSDGSILHAHLTLSCARGPDGTG